MQKSQTNPVLVESRIFQFLATFASLAIFVAGPLATLADSSAMTNPPASVSPTKNIPAIEPSRKTPALVPFDKAVQSISAESIFKHVKILASDEMEGREIGTAGGVRAINYLVRKMRAAGLQPAGPNEKFIQPFDGNGHNVLGWIEGSDPKLKKEFIVIGAHLDHVGNGTNGHTRGPIGPVHNGADDNASGVAVALEVARALAALDKKPKRSFLFIFFDGEEQGLWGSWHWAMNPTVPIANVTMMINLDMVGRLREDRLVVYGTRTAPTLRQQLAECNDVASSSLALDTPWQLLGRSDEKPFFMNRIPVLLLHTGLHDDYHTPRDDAKLLNAKGMQRIAHFLIHVAQRNGDLFARLPFRRESHYDNAHQRQAQEKTISSVGSRFSRLGARWKTDPSKEEQGVEILHVNRYSAANQAGLQVGDRIVGFNGQPVVDEGVFAAAVLGAESPVRLDVRRDGKEEPVSLKIPLAGKPLRLGIAWRRIPAENDVLFITYVVDGSPAWLSGVRPGDRIQAINGQTVPNNTELIRQAAALPAQFGLTLERGGRIRHVEVFPNLDQQQVKPPEIKAQPAAETSLHKQLPPVDAVKRQKAA